MAHEFLCHEAILRRQPAISELMLGLDSLGLLTFIKSVPEIFERTFIYEEEELTPQKVVSLLKFQHPDKDGEAEKIAAKLLVDVLRQATEGGLFSI